MRIASGPRWRRGLTLVEMAACGLMLTSTLAAVAPALHRVRGDSALSGCLANIRAIGAASLTYSAEDPTEQFIPVPVLEVFSEASGWFEWGGKAGRGESSVPGNITYSYYGTRSYRGPAHRPLNPYFYPSGFPDWNPVGGTPNPGPGGINYLNDAGLDLPEFRCPSDTGYAGGGFLYTGMWHLGRPERPFLDEGLTAYDHFGTSYAASVMYSTGGSGGSRLKSSSLYLTPLSRILDPAHQLAYQEVSSRFMWMWGSWQGSSCEWTGYDAQTEGDFNTVSGWHGSPFHFNVAFADGHVATIEIKGCFRPAPNLGRFTYPPGLCAGDDTYTCSRCITRRGPGWQLDSLPADPVPTNWFTPADRGTTEGLVRQ